MTVIRDFSNFADSALFSSIIHHHNKTTKDSIFRFLYYFKGQGAQLLEKIIWGIRHLVSKMVATHVLSLFAL